MADEVKKPDTKPPVDKTADTPPPRIHPSKRPIEK